MKSQGLNNSKATKRLRNGSPKPTLARDGNSQGKSTIDGALSKDDFQSVAANKIRPTIKGNHRSSQKRMPGSSSLKHNSTRTTHTLSTPQMLRRDATTLDTLRKRLPIWSQRLDIRFALRHHDVLLLNGETGSGKSTQMPQFLCTEPWCKPKSVMIESPDGRLRNSSVGGIIAITQPRRVAAITLAQRVAREMGSQLSKGVTLNPTEAKVGYSIRFEKLLPSGMKIKFVTEGTLLQEMLQDPHLTQYSAIIVDEVHERSVDVDLIMGFLRMIVHGDKKGRGGVPLKVVLMSATLDLGGIEAFFALPGTHGRYKPGKNHGRILAPHLLDRDVNRDVNCHVENENCYRNSNEYSSSSSTSSTWNGFSDLESSGSRKEKSDMSKKPKKSSTAVESTRKFQRSKTLANKGRNHGELSDEDRVQIPPKMSTGVVSQSGVAVTYVTGRQYEVEIIYETNPSQDYLQSMLQIILHLHVKEPLPGDILAFLTGQEEIENLQAELESYSDKLVKTLPKMKIMPLYGSLPAQAQQEAFEPLKVAFTRKVVLATNIAETSVTVSGVRFVVDCGKSKVKQYRPRLGMESLLAKPISRVSAIQRAGRAGREAKGKCYRIYTEKDFLDMELDELPEILRSDIIEAVLKMKARGVHDVLTFPLMDSPDILAIEKALLRLHTMGALNDLGHLTEAGKKMARFPLPASYSRVITAAVDAPLDVTLEVIDVIACLTTDSEIFLQPKSEHERESVEEFRKDIHHREGDIVTLLSTVQQYTSTGAGRGDWCRKRMVSLRAMNMAMQIRKQLREICHREGILQEVPQPDPQPVKPISPKIAQIVLKTFLKAFSTNTALLGPDGSYITTQGKNPITIHPSSVLYGQKFEAIMFLDHVFTSKSYAKRVSAVETSWIMENLAI